MTGPVRLREVFLDVAFLSRLVNAPRSFQTGLNIFLKEKMSENKLILVDGLLGYNETEWPLHIVVEGQRLVHFHHSRLLTEVVELLLIHILVLTKSLARSHTGYEELLGDAEFVEDTGDIVLVLVPSTTRCPDCHIQVRVELLL